MRIVWMFHRLGATATLAFAAATVWALPAQPPAHAIGSYQNAAIADHALTFVGQNLGSVNGQCRKFVNDVVWSVSGGTQNLSTSNGGYFGSFLNAGGQEIANYAALVKGDIVQKYVSSSDLHTWIIVSRDPDGYY